MHCGVANIARAGNQTLLDLSLPGTHDTMTYDLDNVSLLD